MGGVSGKVFSGALLIKATVFARETLPAPQVPLHVDEYSTAAPSINLSKFVKPSNSTYLYVAKALNIRLDKFR